MKNRPYIVNDGALPVGYWKHFFARAESNDVWSPPPFRIERKSGQLGDVLGWIGGVPLFSQKATNLLTRATQAKLRFTQFGEIKGKVYWITSRVPAVSNLEPGSIAAAPSVFCVPGSELREVFAKESVPRLVVAEGLRGFEFRRPHESHLRALFVGEDTNDFPGALP